MGYYVTEKVDSGIQNTGINGGKSVTTAELAAVGSSNLDHRTLLTINPEGGDVFWGYTDQVTATPGVTNSGSRISDGTTENFSFIGDSRIGVNIFIVPLTGTVTTNFTEVAKLPEMAPAE